MPGVLRNPFLRFFAKKEAVHGGVLLHFPSASDPEVDEAAEAERPAKPLIFKRRLSGRAARLWRAMMLLRNALEAMVGVPRGGWRARRKARRRAQRYAKLARLMFWRKS